ncbi:MAG TPA: hypothetical protein VLE94_19650 [Burkholderiaceae bacterium]|nr:hypothetical protein [Burkholderiaceae bacterium]
MGHAMRRRDAATTGVAAGASGADLEGALQSVERHLDDLQQALSARDMPRVEGHAGELQRALSHAMERLAQSARRGAAPLALRRRLGLAGAQVAAQRDALARATAALDRAIDLLMPGQREAALYSPSGIQQPSRAHATLEA